MSDWKEYRLDGLMQIKYGKDHKHLADGTYPLYGSGGIMRYVEKPLYDDESILIPRKGTLSNLFYLDQPFWSVDTMFYSKINKDLVLPKYLFYTLKTFDLASLNVGSAVPSLTTEVLNEVLVSIPDLPTQTAIAEILSSLDDKIELNNKINQELENLAQTLFKQWFIDFEFPNENGEPYKSSGGEMVESELGEIPKGWEVKNLKEVTKQIKPGTNFQPKRTSVGIPFLNVKNINSGFINTTDSKLISIEDYHSVHKVWQPEKMDMLISRIGTLGLVAPILDKDLPIAVHYNFILIKPGKLNSKFLYFLLKSDDFQLKYKSLAKASVQEYVTIDEVQDIEILMPYDSLLSNFQITFDSLFDKIESSYSESQELIKLRNTLLPNLISGELKINELPN